MKFPISVEIVDDLIVLCLGEITEEFKTKINNTDRLPDIGDIRSINQPALNGCTIYINGTNKVRNNVFAFDWYSPEQFNTYQQIINHYKEAMGYDE